MKKAHGLFSCLIFALGLVSCNLPAQAIESADAQEVVGQYQTVAVLLTQTSKAVQPEQPVPGSATPLLATRQPQVTLVVPSVTLTFTPVSYTAQGGQPDPSLTPLVDMPTVPCDLARAGMPFDVTIPDDTQLYPGEYFSKTWRLVNAGSCNWDREYAVVWFSGDELGGSRAISFNGVVPAGQSIDITVDMQAPEAPGVYQSNWKLRNNQGALFGIGPGGGAPFWARIVVIPEITETPAVPLSSPTATSTPVVFSSGAMDLTIDTGLDLDSGEVNQVVNDDLRFQLTEQGQLQLQPENGARLTIFGQQAPEFFDCTSVSLSTTPVAPADLAPGGYLCFRTTEGLPGWVVVTAIDVERQLVTLEFVTWAVP